MRVVTSFQVRFMKTGNIFWVDLSSQAHNLCVFRGLFNTAIYLLLNEMSSDDGPWRNKFCEIKTRLMLRWCDHLVNNSLTFLE
jgi:hypothetical protein